MDIKSEVKAMFFYICDIIIMLLAEGSIAVAVFRERKVLWELAVVRWHLKYLENFYNNINPLFFQKGGKIIPLPIVSQLRQREKEIMEKLLGKNIPEWIIKLAA